MFSLARPGTNNADQVAQMVGPQSIVLSVIEWVPATLRRSPSFHYGNDR